MVTSDENGEIIPLNNQPQFIQTVIKLLQDQDELQRLSTGAYDNLSQLAEENLEAMATTISYLVKIGYNIFRRRKAEKNQMFLKPLVVIL